MSRLRDAAAATALVLAFAACDQTANAQPAGAPASAPHSTFRAAATEDRLWVADIRGDRSIVSYRGPSGSFVQTPVVNGAIASLTATDQAAYAFLEDGTFYRCSETWNPAIDLPGQEQPLDLVGVDQVLYGVVPTGLARSIPPTSVAESTPASRTTTGDDAPLSIVRYDSRGWSVVATGPASARADAGRNRVPRLCPADGRLMLCWLIQPNPPEQLACAWLDLASGRWTAGGTLAIPHLKSFWLCLVNRTPTLVAAVSSDGDAEHVRAYRLVADSAGAAPTWQGIDIELTALPSGVRSARCTDAFGFNQHLGVLMTGADGSWHVVFGRFGGVSAIATIDLPATERPAQPLAAVFQALQAFVLAIVIVTLLAFRRHSIVAVVPLPKEHALAFTIQRLGGALIDLIPFAVVFGVVLNVNWSGAARQLVNWALPSQSGNSGVPDLTIVAWWSCTAAAYAVYSLVLELTTHRTVGKLLTGVELASEFGGPATASQIVVRNLLRFLEVLPPFWVLGFIILLSRNRQRLGDIFARTVVIRRVIPPTEDDDRPDA